ncbi:Hypothetical predicted protein [Mytilus galloprovincialis]|uniref:Uncharacterized protein n=1 Tax=Mytilus galloprovincialis TaxID=29158 RepID=A0A8B6HN16_MYTGA|nr:Hypothetical predicted protein [Mytilus galloprovincialis]
MYIWTKQQEDAIATIHLKIDEAKINDKNMYIKIQDEMTREFTKVRQDIEKRVNNNYETLNNQIELSKQKYNEDIEILLNEATFFINTNHNANADYAYNNQAMFVRLSDAFSFLGPEESLAVETSTPNVSQNSMKDHDADQSEEQCQLVNLQNESNEPPKKAIKVGFTPNVSHNSMKDADADQSEDQFQLVNSQKESNEPPKKAIKVDLKNISCQTNQWLKCIKWSKIKNQFWECQSLKSSKRLYILQSIKSHWEIHI